MNKSRKKYTGTPSSTNGKHRASSVKRGRPGGPLSSHFKSVISSKPRPPSTFGREDDEEIETDNKSDSKYRSISKMNVIE